MELFLKKFGKYSFSILLIYSIIGPVCELIIEKNLKNNQFQIQEDWHIKHKVKHDFLFIGNSRTFVQVDVKLLNSKLKDNSYCLSQDGRESKVLFYKLKKYLELNNQPRHVFLQFDPFFLNNRTQGTFYGKQNYLGYLYKNNLGINSIFRNEIGFEQLDVYLPLKRYFSTEGGVQVLIKHLTNQRSADYETFQFGSAPRKRQWRSTESNWSNPEYKAVNMQFNFIDSILNLCRNKKIEVTLVYPPQSWRSYKRLDSETNDELRKFAEKRKIVYWNFNSEKYDNVNYFYNHMHLNSIGSDLYTRDLVDSILINQF